LSGKIFRALLLIALALALVYAGDYAGLWFRIHTNRQPFGSVKVERYYAVPEKNNRTEFMLLEPQNEVCVHSLLPHLGFAPCWYAERHTEERENI
jgi:hypothetical protein